ncbi:MAG TPA: DUF2461 domain-containing protein [Vicinamibacterales bacterium]|jgi:uncharacterized protein (TIGR02453 family)
MSKSAPAFAPDGLSFLRALKRNNRREWFQPRKDRYETLVRAPMIAIVEQLAVDLRKSAPEVMIDPRRAIYRIYRDTRFSADKTPYKTHIAASFPWRGLPRHEGAGLYFHVSPTEIWIGGGMYAPQTTQLQAVREHIARNHRRLRSIVESAAFKRVIGSLEGEQLQRVPRGFAADHPAAAWLKYRQFLAGRELPPAAATKPALYRGILETFAVVMPLVRFINEPLVSRGR